MDKSIYSEQYRILLRELRAARKGAGVTQVELAERLGETQSFISKCERGERHLDVIELKAFCFAIGVKLSVFLEQLERALRNTPPKRRGR